MTKADRVSRVRDDARLCVDVFGDEMKKTLVEGGARNARAI